MKKYGVLLRSGIAVLFTAVIVVTAQPPCEMAKDDGKPCHHMFGDLNLTKEQNAQLKTLHEEMQTMRQKHFEQVKQVREKIKAELLKADASQNTLYGYAGELGELHKEMSKAHGDHLLNVKKILTAEQFVKLVEKQDRIDGCDRFGKMGGCLKKDKGCCPGKEGMEKGKGCCPHMEGAEKGKACCPHQGEMKKAKGCPHAPGASE